MDSMIPMGQQMAVPKTSQTEMMISRQAQEVQGAIVMAKKFPRDEYDAMERIKRTCQRATLAEQAIYSYPRGGQTVMGPSIRLAEALAQNWGNIDYGVIELEQKNGSSEMMAYAWDLESNTRVTKIFTVEHKRDTRKGTYQLTDSRDIYEAKSTILNIQAMAQEAENKENKDDMAFMIKGLEMLVGKDASDKIEALDLPIPEYKEMYNTIMQVAMGTYGEEQTPSA